MPAASTVLNVKTGPLKPEVLSEYFSYYDTLTQGVANLMYVYPPGSLPDSHVELWHGNRCPTPLLGLCKHCYLGDANQGDSTALMQDPPKEYLEALVHIAEQGSFSSAPMVGIEPATSPWTIPLTMLARELGLDTALTTSGVGLSEQRIRILADSRLATACFSYDGSQTGHGLREDGPGRMIAKSIRLAKQAKIDPVGMVTILPGAERMVETVRYLTDLGCSMVSFHPVEGVGAELDPTPLFLHHRKDVGGEITDLISAAEKGQLAGAKIHLEAGAMEAWMILDNLELFKNSGFRVVGNIWNGKVYLSKQVLECEIVVDLSPLRGTENIRLLWQEGEVAITTCRGVCRRRTPIPWHKWHGNLQHLATLREWHEIIQTELDEFVQGYARCATQGESLHEQQVKFRETILSMA